MAGKEIKVLVLGGSGFIGKNLIEYLNANNYLVSSPTHQECDLEDPESLRLYFRKRNFEALVNCSGLGANGKEIPDLAIRNIRMFVNLSIHFRHFKKIIQIGSGAEYDKSRPLIKIKENDFGLNIPLDQYGLGKYVISNFIQKLIDDKHYPIVSLRVFGLFGRYEDSDRRFISKALLESLSGKTITIYQNVKFDYVYIDDFVKIIEWFVQNNSNCHFYNIGRGYPISLLSIAKKINKIKPVDIKVLKRGLANEYSCDNNLLIKELKKFKFSDLDYSLTQLFHWYEKRLSV
jgi:UDP-glucose 4-epimerase